MKLHPVLASLVFTLGLSGLAYAQVIPGLDGRWEGVIERPGDSKITGVFRVETKDGKTSAVFDSPDQGARGIEATVKREGDKVTLGVPMAGLVYNATLSADGKTLAGDVAQGGGAVPMTMKQKAAAPPPTTPAVAGLDGQWEGVIAGSLPLVMRISTANGKTTTLTDSPSQGATDIPALTKRDGQKVVVELPGLSGVYNATLSADGKTLSGFWDQAGQSLELTLTKK